MAIWKIKGRQHKLLEGDTEAFEVFAGEHYPGVLALLGHLTGSRDEAADLTQQTFVSARRHLGSLRNESSLKGWLYRIAYREFLHWLREARTDNGPIPEDYPSASEVGPDAMVLAGAIRSLPEEQRAAFVLRFVHELSVFEVAAVLDIPIGTVKSRCHLARQRLRFVLGPAWGYPAGVETKEIENGI